MEELSVKAVSIAAAATTAIVYIACIAVFAFAPSVGIAAGLLLFHGVSMEALPITAVSALSGFVLAVVGAGVIGAVFAALYNKVLKK